MSYKELTAGKEIDCKCTRCKVVIGHTIVVMEGPTPKRVRCNSCGSEHRYIAAPDTTQQVRKTAVRVRRESGRRKEIRVEVTEPAKPKAAGGTRARSAGRPKVPAPSPADIFHELTKDKELGDPITYSPRETFIEDIVVDHPKFGQGIVTKIRGKKVDIHFRDHGAKTLVHTP